jgi:hypothetical protein
MHFWPLNQVKKSRPKKAEREGLFTHSDHSIEISKVVNDANLLALLVQIIQSINF